MLQQTTMQLTHRDNVADVPGCDTPQVMACLFVGEAWLQLVPGGWFLGPKFITVVPLGLLLAQFVYLPCASHCPDVIWVTIPFGCLLIHNVDFRGVDSYNVI
jgi:hypothetical protein